MSSISSSGIETFDDIVSKTVFPIVHPATVKEAARHPIAAKTPLLRRRTALRPMGPAVFHLPG